MQPKSIFTSKLGWLGAAVTALGILQDLQTVDWAKTFANHPGWAGGIVTALGGAIVVLRLYTTKPASVTAPITK